DRDLGRRSRLAEQGRLHQRRRPPARRRHLRDLPRPMSQAADPTQPPVPPAAGGRVTIVTGASRGIGAGLVAAFRRLGYSVVATSLSMSSSDDEDILTV